MFLLSNERIEIQALCVEFQPFHERHALLRFLGNANQSVSPYFVRNYGTEIHACGDLERLCYTCTCFHHFERAYDDNTFDVFVVLEHGTKRRGSTPLDSERTVDGGCVELIGVFGYSLVQEHFLFALKANDGDDLAAGFLIPTGHGKQSGGSDPSRDANHRADVIYSARFAERAPAVEVRIAFFHGQHLLPQHIGRLGDDGYGSFIFTKISDGQGKRSPVRIQRQHDELTGLNRLCNGRRSDFMGKNRVCMSFHTDDLKHGSFSRCSISC